jgi:hypothetical protein
MVLEFVFEAQGHGRGHNGLGQPGVTGLDHRTSASPSLVSSGQTSVSPHSA